MPVDADDIIRRGGAELIDLFNYSVFSKRPDLIFALLVRDYQYHPTALGAVGLFDAFCAPDAPVRLTTTQRIPPNDPGLIGAIRPLRTSLENRMQFVPSEEFPEPPAVTIPPKYIFDAVLESVRPAIRELAQSFDPALGAIGNLPGGKLNPSQRAYIDRNWGKAARPMLVNAGFHRVRTLGQA